MTTFSLRSKQLLVAVLGGLTLTGCPRPAAPPPEPVETKPAPVVERLSLISTPPGARARLSTGESCTTPCSLQKVADIPFSVTFEKENYSPQTVKVTNNLEVMRQYNARRGMKVDESALERIGTIKLVPNPVSVELEPEWSK